MGKYIALENVFKNNLTLYNITGLLVTFMLKYEPKLNIKYIKIMLFLRL